MKKANFLWNLLTIAMVAMLNVAFVSSCKDHEDEPVPEPELSISSPTDSVINLKANGDGDKTISVTANNTDWNADVSYENGSGWLTLGDRNGNTISFTVSENTSKSERKAKITIKATKKESLYHIVTVTQASADGYILVNGNSTAQPGAFPGLFNGKAGVDYKEAIAVKANVGWNATGVPDWLNVSPLSGGSGDITISIYPKNENESASPRKATITLAGEGVTATIEVEQDRGRAVEKVTPSNLVALYDRMCWEYTASGNVNKFQYIILQEGEYNRMTDKELLEELKQEEELKYVDNWLTYSAYDSHDNRITASSTYYFVSVAYDGNGNAGELSKTPIKTPAYLDADNDAWVNFDEVYSNSSSFWFDAIKEGYCNTYHLIYGVYDEILNPAVYAFEINYYIKNKKKHWLAGNNYVPMEIVTDYPNNHTFTYTTNYFSYFPVCFAYGWGIFKDGSLSSDLVGFQWDKSENEVKCKMPSRSSDAPKFESIKLSDFKKKQAIKSFK